MTYKPITPQQLKMVHMLLHQTGLASWKKELIHSFSGGRTTSSRELTAEEAKSLINRLKENSEKESLIRRIWYLAYESGIIYDAGDEDIRLNAGKIDLFCKMNGTVKKSLTDQTLAELKRTHRQFEAINRRCKEKQDREQYIADLQEGILICSRNEDYEACAILRKMLDEETMPKRKRKDERISTKR
ncbi:MAG: hypothetical protein HDR92_09600 [Bacteroides sp.]|nr:hypothetical protein [Bacteroides sp.]MBD5347362.1 hypothetical protein [Bacteroides sp.]